MDLGREGRIFGELVIVAANRLRCVLGVYRMGLQPKAFHEQSNVSEPRLSGRLALADAAEVLIRIEPALAELRRQDALANAELCP